jgi:hypothetical protein
MIIFHQIIKGVLAKNHVFFCLSHENFEITVTVTVLSMKFMYRSWALNTLIKEKQLDLPYSTGWCHVIYNERADSSPVPVGIGLRAMASKYAALVCALSLQRKKDITFFDQNLAILAIVLHFGSYKDSVYKQRATFTRFFTRLV